MPGIVSRLKEIGHTACATTDHASLSAIFPSYHALKEAGIKYLPGIEFYIVGDRTRGRQMNNHLVCIARNQKGWQNLLRLNYEGYRTGSTMIYDRTTPRIDMGILENHTEGLVVASACLAGIPSQMLKNGLYADADEYVKRMAKLFYDKEIGESTYFLEVQCVDFYRMLSDNEKVPVFDKRWIERQARDQKIVNDRIIDLATKHNIPLICTTDAHYVSRADREAHLLLLAIQSKTNINQPTDGPGGRLAFEATSMLSTQELINAFTETDSGFNGYSQDQVESWIRNTMHASDLVEEPTYLESKGYQLPEFPVEKSNDFSNFCAWKGTLDKTQIDKIIFDNEQALQQKVVSH